MNELQSDMNGVVKYHLWHICST